MLRGKKLGLYGLFCFFFIHTNGLYAQDSLQTADTEMQPEQMPYFEGCQQLLDGSVEKRNCSNLAVVQYIAQHLDVPPNLEAVGTVYVSFIVNETGQVENPKILRGIAPMADSAALKVVAQMPLWSPALLNSKPTSVRMTLPIRFVQRDESSYSNGFQLTWGTVRGDVISKKALLQLLQTPLTVRDDSGNTLEINELIFERDRSGKFTDAHSNGSLTEEMIKIVKKLKEKDKFTVTATVQKKGQFYYVDKTFTIGN